MQRTIKFRAYDKEKGVMISDFLKFVEEQIYNHIGNPWRSERYIPMQFTGLKDKNGVEIYEGDLVKEVGDVYEIVFHEGGFTVRNTDSPSAKPASNEYLRVRREKLEVIGNIYEHKHLLSEEGE